MGVFGPLAHLVERIHGMDEVTGSIPVRSTIVRFAGDKIQKQPVRRVVFLD